MHIASYSFFVKLAVPNLGYNLNWIVQMLFILASSYLFYLIFERPSQSLAKYIGRRLSDRQRRDLHVALEPK